MTSYEQRLGTVLADVGAEADAELAGAWAASTLAQSQVTVLEADNASLVDVNASLTAANEQLTVDNQVLNASNDALTAANATLTDANRRLRKRLSELEPPPPAYKLIVGSSCGKHTYDYFTQQAGTPLLARRSYDNPRISLVGSSVAADVGRCASVNSVAFNPADIATAAPKVEAYLSSFPTDHRLFFIVSHEPENPSKNYDPALYRVQQLKVREIVDRVNAGRSVPISFGGNWMAYSVRPKPAGGGRDMASWFPGDGVWDFLAYDGYASKPEYGPNTVFGDAVAFNTARNIPFAIAETGIDVSVEPTARATWIDACQQYAADQHATFWTYWDGSFSTFWLNTVDEFKAVVVGP